MHSQGQTHSHDDESAVHTSVWFPILWKPENLLKVLALFIFRKIENSFKKLRKLGMDQKQSLNII